MDGAEVAYIGIAFLAFAGVPLVVAGVWGSARPGAAGLPSLQ